MRKAVLVVVLLWPPWLASAAPYGGERHPEDAASTGYFRDQEVTPGGFQLYQQLPEARGGFWGVGPGGGPLQRTSFAADAHAGLRDYDPRRNCLDCHEGAERNLHSARTAVTCRQCHRNEPIEGVYHYYSPLNPIRRHAYVCAKCHQGATANFATYVVHEPNPIAAETRVSFPALYYAVWAMLILAGGVFLFFLPYVGLWGLRELVGMIRGGLRRGST